MRREETTSLPIGIAGLPITLDEAKRHARIEIAKDDALLTLYIEAATRSIEAHVNKRYTDRAFELLFDHEDFKGECCIELERFNDVITIVSITSFDEDHVSTPVPPAAFTLVGRRIQFEDTFSDIDFRTIDALEINYTVTAVQSPEDINTAIKKLIAHMSEHRGPIALGTTIVDIPGSILMLIQGEKLWNV